MGRPTSLRATCGSVGAGYASFVVASTVSPPAMISSCSVTSLSSQCSPPLEIQSVCHSEICSGLRAWKCTNYMHT
ncbi:hypothetical protein BOTBODRAFT_587838 [Botryobasidium botryosum FD-172 SS1]|uniref:Uncharacterized protein n=1 Tax=Botryobasidium botryosum (strain FD-172 SS1) TaxID=930990 RepID=A0A067LXQ9_BOTB1|nr:hypothetical protein BOTBODRAFT_587838 [Botryobasidium botryosum FD-172 SS1]